MDVSQAVAQAESPQAAALAATSPVEATESAQPEAPAREEDPKFAAKFAALTRREKQILEREAKVKAEEAEFKAWKKSRESAKIDPITFLKQHDLDYNTVTEKYLESIGHKKELTAEEKIELLQKELEEDRRTRALEKEQASQAELDQVITHHKKAIKDLVDSSGDEYELIKAENAYDVVFHVMEEHWKNTGGLEGGEILPHAKAAKLVEDHLYGLAQEFKEKMLKLKKFSPKEVSEQVGDEAPKTSSAPMTLTNRAATSPPSVETTGYVSDEESKRRAAAMLKWNT